MSTNAKVTRRSGFVGALAACQASLFRGALRDVLHGYSETSSRTLSKTSSLERISAKARARGIGAVTPPGRLPIGKASIREGCAAARTCEAVDHARLYAHDFEAASQREDVSERLAAAFSGLL